MRNTGPFTDRDIEASERLIRKATSCRRPICVIVTWKLEKTTESMEPPVRVAAEDSPALSESEASTGPFRKEMVVAPSLGRLVLACNVNMMTASSSMLIAAVGSA